MPFKNSWKLSFLYLYSMFAQLINCSVFHKTAGVCLVLHKSLCDRWSGYRVHTLICKCLHTFINGWEPVLCPKALRVISLFIVSRVICTCMSLLNNEHFTRQLINGIWNCLRVCKDDIYSVVLYSPNFPHPSNSVVNLNIIWKIVGQCLHP